MNKIYFPNLNGLRFIAALLVIVHHIEQIKFLLGYENYWQTPFITVVGKLGVILFFVLSGFLITYLLLAEEQKTKRISIKDFYIRRILRIWPLYYLVVLLSFFVFSKFNFFQLADWSALLSDHYNFKLLLFLLFLPNLEQVLFDPVPYAAQAWSVGVEEQFYLIWPVLMKYFKNKERLLYGIIFGYMFMNIFGFALIEKYIFWNNKMWILKAFWKSFSIDCMAIGGLYALYLFRKDKILNFLFNKYLQFFTILLLCILITFGVKIPEIHFEFYAVLFGIVILNLAANPKPMLNFENATFNYLGKISYGLYMYHPLAIMISLKLLFSYGIKNLAVEFALSLLIAIIIASLSYHFYESYFIKMKVKFSKIISGENARKE